jgi:hypothetical protein
MRTEISREINDDSIAEAVGELGASIRISEENVSAAYVWKYSEWWYS